MMPEQPSTHISRSETGAGGRWYRFPRCSICLHFLWFRSNIHHEPVDAPEPRRAWVLCRRCHEALLVEMRRSSIQSSARLRIAMGLVAAERSPKAYMSAQARLQREFFWAIWFLVLFALLHVAIFAVLLAIPR